MKITAFALALTMGLALATTLQAGAPSLSARRDATKAAPTDPAAALAWRRALRRGGRTVRP